MSVSGYTEPHYICSAAAGFLASENREVRVSSTTLHSLNIFLDEFLHLTVHTALLPSSASNNHSSSTVSSNSASQLPPLPLTTERIKTHGILRILPNQLGKNAVLEAELAIREWVRQAGGRGGEARGDPALRKNPSPNNGNDRENKTGNGNTPAEVGENIFRDLRIWAEKLSGLSEVRWTKSGPNNSQGAASTPNANGGLTPGGMGSSRSASPGNFPGAGQGSVISPSPVPFLLVPADFAKVRDEISRQLSPASAAWSSLPGASGFSPNTSLSPGVVTPALAIYIERVLAFIGEYILRGSAAVVERDPGKGVAGVSELYAAVCEDEAIWDCFQTMRVRLYMEHELQHSKRSKRKHGSLPPSSHSGTPGAASSTRTSSSPGPHPRSPNEDGQFRPGTSNSSSSGHGGGNKGGASILQHSGTGVSYTTPARVSTSSDGGKMPILSSINTGVSSTAAPRSADGGKVTKKGSLRGRSASATHQSGGNGTQTLTQLDNDTREVASWLDFAEGNVMHDEEEEEFEKLMLSGETMKVSLTPNRLKSMEAYAREKAIGRPARQSASPARSASLDTITRSPPPQPTPSLPKQRLKARPARPSAGVDVEESIEEGDEEFDSEDEALGIGKKKRPEQKESLLDFLASAPPWEADEPPVNNLPKKFGGDGGGPGGSRARLTKSPPSTSARPSSPPLSTSNSRVDEFASPTSVRVNPMNTPKNAKSQPNLRRGGDDSDDDEVLNAKQSPGVVRSSSRRNLRDQVSRDLVDFLDNTPPPPTPMLPSPENMSSSVDGKKRSGRFKNIVSRFTGSPHQQLPHPTEEEEAAFRGTSNNHTNHTRKSSKGGSTGISSEDVKRMGLRTQKSSSSLANTSPRPMAPEHMPPMPRTTTETSFKSADLSPPSKQSELAEFSMLLNKKSGTDGSLGSSPPTATSKLGSPVENLQPLPPDIPFSQSLRTTTGATNDDAAPSSKAESFATAPGGPEHGDDLNEGNRPAPSIPHDSQGDVPKRTHSLPQEVNGGTSSNATNKRYSRPLQLPSKVEAANGAAHVAKAQLVRVPSTSEKPSRPRINVENGDGGHKPSSSAQAPSTRTSRSSSVKGRRTPSAEAPRPGGDVLEALKALRGQFAHATSPADCLVLLDSTLQGISGSGQSSLSESPVSRTESPSAVRMATPRGDGLLATPKATLAPSSPVSEDTTRATQARDSALQASLAEFLLGADDDNWTPSSEHNSTSLTNKKPTRT